MQTFRIKGLRPEPFAHLFGLDDAQLAQHGARRYIVDAAPGFPDRVEIRDLEPGERAILVNYVHHDVESPYRSSHAIFVREGATTPYESTGEVPRALRIRTLSVRAFDREHMMLDAELVEGSELEGAIERLFANPAAAYLHAHHAKRGCFAARIDR